MHGIRFYSTNSKKQAQSIVQTVCVASCGTHVHSQDITHDSQQEKA